MFSARPAFLSERVTVDPAGRLLFRAPGTGHHHLVTGTRDDGPNTPYRLTTARQPTTPTTQAEDRARRSHNANRLLLALLALLVLAGFTRCTTARPVTAAHSTLGETAAPACLTTPK